MAVVSLIVALAALLVAGASLYLSMLRAGSAVVDVVSARVHRSEDSGDVPTKVQLSLSLLVSNDGARAVLLERVLATDVTAPPHTFWDLEQSAYDAPQPREPAVIEANGSRSWVHVYGLTPASAFDGKPERYAEAIAKLDSFTVTLRWTFHASRGLLPSSRRLLPGVLTWQRRTFTREAGVPVDCTQYRRDLAHNWREMHRPDLADLVDPDAHAPEG